MPTIIMTLFALPKDVIWLVFNEWLYFLKDFVSFDKALTNKSLRDFFYNLISSHPQPTNGSINFVSDCIPVKFSEVERMWNWEKSRGVFVRKIVVKYAEKDAFITFGSLAYIETLDLSAETRDINYRLFEYFASLPCLRRFFVGNGRIVISSKDLDVAVATKVIELSLCGIISIDLVGEDTGELYSEDSTPIPVSDCGKVYLKIAQCCPKLQSLEMLDCYGAVSANIVPMIKNLSELAKWRYYFPSDHDYDMVANNIGSMVSLSPPPKVSSIFIYIKDDNYNDLEVIFSCCDGQYLRHAEVSINFLSRHFLQLLLHFIAQHWTHLETLTMEGEHVPLCLPLCLRVCQQLQQLQISYSGMIIDENTITPLVVPNTLPHLRTLSMDECKLTDRAISILCTSSVAPQLTSLKICNTCSASLTYATYLRIFGSFPHLQDFSICVLSNERELRRSFDIVSLFNVLFGEECSFANTIQTLEVNANFCRDDLGKPEHEALAEELYDRCMVPYWTFPFPYLRSFSIRWQVNHDKMSRLIRHRLLDGRKHPRLHTIKLDTHEHDKLDKYNLVVKNLPEVIRQLQEKVKEEEL